MSSASATRRRKRDEILAAATERFGRDGYEDTKWADIAADVGVGPTALYHYFESKQHCLYVIMDQAIEGFRSRFEALTAATAATRSSARGGHRRLLRPLRARRPAQPRPRRRAGPAVRPQRLAARGGGAPGRAGAHARPRVRLGELPRRARCSSGAIPKNDPRLLTRAILGLYNSIWHWYRPERDRRAATASPTFFTDRSLALIGVAPEAPDAGRAAA